MHSYNASHNLVLQLYLIKAHYYSLAWVEQIIFAWMEQQLR